MRTFALLGTAGLLLALGATVASAEPNRDSSVNNAGTYYAASSEVQFAPFATLDTVDATVDRGHGMGMGTGMGVGGASMGGASGSHR
jgi:hypothetical protein